MFIRTQGKVWEFQYELTDAEVMLNIKNRLNGVFPFERLTWDELTFPEKIQLLSEKAAFLTKNVEEYQRALTNLRSSMKAAEFKLQKHHQGYSIIGQFAQ
jgi:hypothetical protein